jgi:predicted TIM-barrel fold metal-dependent hydrolase
MIVDSHQHPDPSVPQVMKQHGIDVSVLLPVGGEELRRVQQMVCDDPEKYVPFFWIDVAHIAQSISALREAVPAWGCKGIKFQPLIQHCCANDQRLYPVYELCSELGLVVLFHCGAVAFTYELGLPHLTRYAHPIHIDEVAFDFPEMPIILAHMGGNYFYEALIMAEKHDNIFLDTAYLPFFCQRMLPDVTPIKMIQRGVDILGAERILYGYEGLAPSIIQQSQIDEQSKALILGLNAVRLFGLDG